MSRVRGLELEAMDQIFSCSSVGRRGNLVKVVRGSLMVAMAGGRLGAMGCGVDGGEKQERTLELSLKPMTLRCLVVFVTC